MKSRIVKRGVCFALALAMMSAGAMAVLAKEYDIEVGSFSVALDNGTQCVTQENNSEANNTPDDNVVIRQEDPNTPNANTITVDAGAKVTVESVFLSGRPGNGGNDNTPPVTVTDKNHTGEAATIVMKDSDIYGDDQYDNSQNATTAGILVEAGANLDLQISGDNVVMGGYKQHDAYGDVDAAAIQLEDGATLTISDYDKEGSTYGQLYVNGGMDYENFVNYYFFDAADSMEYTAGTGIGTANNSNASATVNFVQNNDLYVQSCSGSGAVSGAGIGTGANSTGNVTVNMNGGVILGYYSGFDSDGDGIGLGYGATGAKNLYVDGDPNVYAENE